MPNPTTIMMNTDDRPCPHGFEGQDCLNCGQENMLIQKIFCIRGNVRAFDSDELLTAFRMGFAEARAQPGKSMDEVMAGLFNQ